jgi:hypothetical protein
MVCVATDDDGCYIYVGDGYMDVYIVHNE